MPYCFVPATFDLALVHEYDGGERIGRSLEVHEMSDGALCEYLTDLDSLVKDVHAQVTVARRDVEAELRKRGVAA